jgi:hypothetical protein
VQSARKLGELLLKLVETSMAKITTTTLRSLFLGNTTGEVLNLRTKKMVLKLREDKANVKRNNMAFKIKSPFHIDNTPVYFIDEEKGVLGRANKNGTITINKDIKKR